MNSYVKFFLVLFLVVAISCGLLALVNRQTHPIIKQNKALTQEKARRDMIPSADDFTKVTVNDFEYYKALDVNKNLLGYTFLAKQKGYSGLIEVMVAVNTSFEIIRIMVITQTETPGLGTQVTLPKFADMFIGLVKSEIKIDREGGKIVNITGATISTNAVTKAIANDLQRLEKAAQEEDK
ncbi:MAG: FMN-binding protein [Candidatus Cloacimonetes bacterium]|nr:FMN-binding protein [Candidatus Cloacimonadota bacterium]